MPINFELDGDICRRARMGSDMRNELFTSLADLRVHGAGGMLILALMVIRLIIRMLTSKPADATTGYPLLDRIAPISHYGFYVLILLMAGPAI